MELEWEGGGRGMKLDRKKIGNLSRSRDALLPAKIPPDYVEGTYSCLYSARLRGSRRRRRSRGSQV